jgi:hypothetical protein
MNLKFIQKGETFLSFKPASIADKVASQNLIQVQDYRGNVLYGTIEYPDTEENRIKLKELYE